MTIEKYKINIDFQNKEVLYTPLYGHKKPSKLMYEDITHNPEFMNNFSGKDAYLVGTIYASKLLGKLDVHESLGNYKFLGLISVLFVTIILLSNILSTKLVSLAGFTVTGAMLIYPFSYVFDYILNDVYGYQYTRRVLWSAIISLCLFDIAIYAVVKLPPSPFWGLQDSLESIFGGMLRTFVASTIAFSFSFFLSSYVFQKMKIKNNGRFLFRRVFQSLLVSEICDTMLFCLIAFYGIWPVEHMAKYIIVSYFTKVTYEIGVYSILTKPLINIIKNKERSDIVDWNTDFSPLSWNISYNSLNNIYSKQTN